MKDDIWIIDYYMSRLAEMLDSDYFQYVGYNSDLKIVDIDDLIQIVYIPENQGWFREPSWEGHIRY